MSLDELISYVSEFPHVEEGYPFGPEILVYKVNKKVFLLTNLDKIPLQFNLKCDPERAIVLREQYSGITAGYHMNKKHWNTIVPGPGISNQLIKELIAHSYDLVIKKK